MKEFMGVREFCETFGVTQSHVYRLVKEGSIPYYKIGSRIILKISDFRQEKKNEDR